MAAADTATAVQEPASLSLPRPPLSPLKIPSRSPRRSIRGANLHQDSDRRTTVCFSEWSRRSTPGNSEAGKTRRSSQANTDSQYKFGYGPKKKTPALRAKDLWHLIMNHADSEEKGISGNNLGIKSGTCVVDDLVMQRVQRQLLLLHTLCVEHDQAAEVVGQLARGLTHEQIQKLQVLCDSTGHEHLSDFIRLSVYNTGDPFAKHPIEGPDLRAARSASRARTPRTPPPPSPPLPRRRCNPPMRDELIRFAGFLPEGHPLSQVAYGLYQSRDGWGMYDQDGEDYLSMSDQGSYTSSSLGHNSTTPEHMYYRGSHAHGPSWDGGAHAHAHTQLHQHHRHHHLNQQQRELRHHQEQGYRHQQLMYQGEQEGRDTEAEGLPLWTDMQRRWWEKNHTIIRDEMFNPVVVGKPLSLYSVLPDFKQKAMAEKRAAEEAAAAANSKGPLPRLQIPSYVHPSDVPFSPAAQTASSKATPSQRLASRERPLNPTSPNPSESHSLISNRARSQTSTPAAPHLNPQQQHQPTSNSQPYNGLPASQARPQDARVPSSRLHQQQRPQSQASDQGSNKGMIGAGIGQHASKPSSSPDPSPILPRSSSSPRTSDADPTQNPSTQMDASRPPLHIPTSISQLQAAAPKSTSIGQLQTSAAAPKSTSISQLQASAVAPKTMAPPSHSAASAAQLPSIRPTSSHRASTTSAGSKH